MPIDIEQLNLYFKKGIKSVDLLNKHRVERERIRKNIWAIRASKDAVVIQIKLALDYIDQSLKEITEECRAVNDLFAQEITTWTKLKSVIEKEGSDDSVKGFLTLLEKIHKDQADLVPEAGDEVAIEIFLKKMRVSKAARVFKG